MNKQPRFTDDSELCGELSSFPERAFSINSRHSLGSPLSDGRRPTAFLLFLTARTQLARVLIRVRPCTEKDQVEVDTMIPGARVILVALVRVRCVED